MTQFVDIVVPQVGEAVAEVRLIRWLKEPGDKIKIGDVLFEIDTDKATVEIEAYEQGELHEIVVGDDSSVMPQQVVGRIAVAGAGSSPPEDHESADAADMPAARAGNESDDPPRVPGPEIQPPLQKQRRDRSSASPRAKAAAKRLGVELASVIASRPDGMISVEDVEHHAGQGTESASNEVPTSRMRRVMAERMSEVASTVPHFYLSVDIDMSEVETIRERLHNEGRSNVPTATAFVIRACSWALAHHPEVQVSYQDGALLRRNQTSVGVAIDTDDGLVVATVPDSGNLTTSLNETSDVLAHTIERARTGRLTPAELGPKIMVVSNLGMYGIDAFSAIVDPPDPMILAVGRISDRVTAKDGAIAVRPISTFTLSADHRAIDGASAARFLTAVRHALESPSETYDETTR